MLYLYFNTIDGNMYTVEKIGESFKVIDYYYLRDHKPRLLKGSTYDVWEEDMFIPANEITQRYT